MRFTAVSDPKWSIDIGRWCEGAIVAQELVARKIVGEVFRRVILRTPVRTGRARGNWQSSTGSPASGALGESCNAPVGTAPVLRALEVVRGWQTGAGAVYLANNLPYIERLENGWSRQAPSGMVALTIAEFGGIVEDAAAEAKARGVAAYVSEWNIGEAGE